MPTRRSTLLGSTPYIDQPYYVAFNAGSNDIGLDPNRHARGMSGSVAFWRVADIAKSIEQLVSLGAQPGERAKDVGGGISSPP